MLNKLTVSMGILSSLVLFSGCATKQDTRVAPVIIEKKDIAIETTRNKKIVNFVATDNAPVQRAVVDAGVLLKTHISAYKDNSGNLIAAHDVFFWARRPDFITTNSLPKRKLSHSYTGPYIDFGSNEIVNLDEIKNNASIKDLNEQKFDEKINAFIESAKK